MESISNIKAAVTIIAALSLLLGLSLGQNYLQHKKIQSLESIANVKPMVEPNIFVTTDRCRGLRRYSNRAHLEEKRVEMEALRQHLQAEQARLKAEVLRFQEAARQQQRDHVIILR